jgi:ribosomal-protein-alanine N-acetyltransferase
LTYSIRRMEKGDLPQVYEIDREAFPTQWPSPNYRQELQNRIAYYIILCDDKRKAPVPEKAPRRGLAASLHRLLSRRRPAAASEDAIPHPTTQYVAGFSGIWMMAGEAHITNIALRQEYQGRGLGEMLLIATIDLAASLNAGFITLEVRVSNQVARRLYEKYGFTQTGVRRSYYLDNREDAMIMSTEPIVSPAFQENLRIQREDLSRRLG